MFKVSDICARFMVNEQTVLGWIRRGELRAVNVGRKPGSRKPRWRISQEALDAFEASRTPAAPAPRKARAKRPGDVIAFY
jgi:excisionase family DNA binding protein